MKREMYDLLTALPEVRANIELMAQRAPASAPAEDVFDAQKRVLGFTPTLDAKTLKGASQAHNKTSEAQRQAILADLKKMRPFFDSLMEFPQMKSQRNAIDEIKAMAASELEAPTIQNIAPTLAYIDRLSNGNISKAYRQPESSQDFKERIMKYQALQSKAENELMDNLTNLFAASKIGETKTGSENSLRIEVGNNDGRGNGNPQVNNPMERIWTEFKRISQPQIEALDGIKNARKLLEEGKPIADAQFQRYMLKAAGETRPTDYDVRSIGANPLLINRFNTMLERNFDTGSMTDLDRDQARAIVDLMEKLQLQKIQQKAQDHAESAADFQPSLAGVDKARISKVLLLRAGVGAGAGVPPPLSPEEFFKKYDEEQKAKQQGK